MVAALNVEVICDGGGRGGSGMTAPLNMEVIVPKYHSSGAV